MSGLITSDAPSSVQTSRRRSSPSVSTTRADVRARIASAISRSTDDGPPTITGRSPKSDSSASITRA